MKSPLEPTTEDAFGVGKLEGTRETLEEILEIAKTGNLQNLQIYLAARLKSLTEAKLNNPFRRNK